ncbi:MAG: hypothetical protein ACYSU7_20050, partial [Planctomycetota bacterium]
IRVWVRALDRVDLDPSQRAEIDRITLELRRAAQAYQGTRRTRPGEPSARKRREPGDSLATAPDIESYQWKMWALLDETQRVRMREVLAEVRSPDARDRTGSDRPPPRPDGALDLDEAGRRRLAFLTSLRSTRQRRNRPDER